MAWYIEEVNDLEGTIAFYGPFRKDEVNRRLNDSYADLLALAGGDLEVVPMTPKEAAGYYINPRAFWMEQLSNSK